jgi:flavin reductase (DIM6/NTAB) family NADH-FMN oxidoreductase RutF
MKRTDVARLCREDVVDLIGKQWMLITAGSPQQLGTMTASWGGVGFLWNKPVAFVFIRPERYTYDFVERAERMTLSFFDESYRSVLQFCGTKSGRDHDKVAETGLSPISLEGGGVAFQQARLVVEGRKLYRAEMTPEQILDTKVLDQWYGEHPGGSMHTLYVVEIEAVYEQE